ncbi:hypothetical protein D3C72_882470 [compost metagenome]
MDARADVGLGHRHRLAEVQLALHGLGQDRRLRGAAQDAALRIAQHAQPAIGNLQRGFGSIAAVGVARIGVVAGAEEDEVVALGPAQEGDVLFQHGGIDGGGGRGLQLLDRVAHRLDHGGVIGHGGAHVGHGLGQAFAQNVAALLGQGIDDDDDQRVATTSLDLSDGVEQGAHGDAGLGQLAQHAVDQEGGVVLQDQDAVIAGRGAVGADQGSDRDAGGLAGLTRLGRTPDQSQQGGQIVAAQFRRLVGGVVVEGLGQEGLFGSARRAVDNARIGRLQRLQGGWRGGNSARSGGHGEVSDSTAGGRRDLTAAP